MRDDEVWNHETPATRSSRMISPFLSSFSLLSFLFRSLIHRGPLFPHRTIGDDVRRAARSLPSSSRSFSLVNVPLVFGLLPDEWCRSTSILFLPLSPRVILPSRNRFGQRTDLGCRRLRHRSPCARQPSVVRRLFLPRERGESRVARGRPKSETASIIVKEVPRGATCHDRARLRRSHLSLARALTTRSLWSREPSWISLLR